jgi:large subunit ribosomal protein L4
MAAIQIYDAAGGQLRSFEVNDRVFGAPANMALVHQVVVAYLANQRQGTVSTLTRGEVSGGGKKPYRQKGTGRARQGSTRAPHWTGGGVVFGPKPREWRQRIPQKMRQGALRCALSDKLRQDRIRVVDSFGITAPETKRMAAILNALALQRKVLLVLDQKDEAVLQSARNLPEVQLVPASILNTYDVLNAHWILTTEAAIRVLEEKLS